MGVRQDFKSYASRHREATLPPGTHFFNAVTIHCATAVPGEKPDAKTATFGGHERQCTTGKKQKMEKFWI